MIIENYSFDIYLEGYLIPGVLYFTIQETSSHIPNAVIAIAGNSKSLKLLAGTVVQIFGKELKNAEENSILLYEGEITSIAYGYNKDNGDTITINTHSLLSQFYSTRLRPADSIVSAKESKALGLPGKSIWLKSKKFKRSSSSVTKTKSPEKDYSNKTFDISSGLDVIMSSDALNFAMAMGENSPGKEGNFIPFFKTVNSMFNQSDVLYAINAKSFNLFESMFLFPNPGLPNYFQVKVMLEALQRANSNIKLQFGSDILLSIAMFFNSFKDRMYYRSIAPAAMTSSNLFYSDVEEYKNSFNAPIREYYIPGIESGPPALPNIIFPEEIVNINFSRDLYGEVTRVLMRGSIPISNSSITKALMPVVLSPDVSSIISGEPPNDVVSSTFTDEELYRGVNLKKITIDGMLNKILIDELKEEGDSGKKELTEGVAEKRLKSNYGGVSDALQITADRQYVVDKFNTRNMTISTNWNPNYIVGLPGMVFMNNMPTFVGIVEQADHRCSTSGAVSTTVTMSNCRIIFDDETTTTKLDPVINPLSDSLMSEESETAIYGGFKYMFSNELYSFEKMGEFLYNYIITGRINKKVFDEVELSGGDKKWSEFKNIPDSTVSDELDYSILKYIKDKDFNIKQEVLDKVSDYKKSQGLEEVEDEVKNGIYLKEAIKAFKEKYNSLQDEDNLNKSSELFRYNIKKRNIINKNDYLNFIGGHNSNKHNKVVESDTKDLAAIVNEVLGGDLTFLKKIILNLHLPTLYKAEYAKLNDVIISIDGEVREIEKELVTLKAAPYASTDATVYLSMVDEKLKDKNNYNYVVELRKKRETLKLKKEQYIEAKKVIGEEISKDTTSTNHILSLFKPYNRTRKAHVIESFKDFISVFDILVKGN